MPSSRPDSVESFKQPVVHDSVGDKLSREGALLMSLPEYAASGLLNRITEASQHKLLTGLEFAGSVALAAGLTVLTKNPGTIGTIAANSSKIFAGLALVDGARRLASPMVDTWLHPTNLQHDKEWMGNNVGAALFDYPLVAVGGLAGDKLGSLALEDGGRFGFMGDKSLLPKQVAMAHGRIAAKHLLDTPVILGFGALQNHFYPSQGADPAFPKTEKVPKLSQFPFLFSNKKTEIPLSSTVNLTKAHATDSFGLNVSQAGTVRLDVNAAAPGTDWQKPNAESAVMSVYVDGKYTQDVVLFGGAQKTNYALSLGELQAGKHSVTLRYAPEKSPSGASGVDVSAITAEAPTFSNPVNSWVNKYSPILYGRHGLDNNHDDTPLGMFYYDNKQADGSTNITYGYVFSNEDGGDGAQASREQALWGRLTDIQTVLRVNVDKNGNLNSAQYEGTNDTLYPFHGKFEGTHPILHTATTNNLVSDSGDNGPLKFDMPAAYPIPPGEPQGDLMRTNPSWFGIEEKELSREHKIDTTGNGDTPAYTSWAEVQQYIALHILGENLQMADPRRYLYVQFDAQNAANGPIAATVQLKNGQTFYSDMNSPSVAIPGNGWQQTAVLLPPGTDASQIEKVSYVSRGKGQGQVVGTGHLFMLGDNNQILPVTPPIVQNLK